MNDETHPVLGIDFGTSYSRIARWAKTGPISYQCRTGRLQMASAAYSNPGSGEMLVGDLALARGMHSPDCAVQNIKRHLGEPAYTVSLGGKILTPTDIAADILSKLMSDVHERYPRGVFQSAGAVITHPYCFKYPQIVALREAAVKAEINVLRLIPDTVVVPLVYEFGVGAKSKDQSVVVFDLGGGMLDVTVLHVVSETHRTIVEVLATVGDDHFGGIDFDETIVNLALERTGLDLGEFDEATKHRALAKMRQAAGEAKMELSATARCCLVVPDVVPGRHVDIDLSGAEIEDACGAHMGKILRILEDVVVQSGLPKQDISRVVITGGASRMPVVVRLVRDAIGIEPQRFIESEHAVARGAAILAAAEDSRFEQGEIVLNLRMPYAVGVHTSGGVFSTLFPENTSIPSEVTQTIGTMAAQTTKLQIDLFQGSSDENTKIGTVVIAETPKVARLPVPVTIAVDAQQMISFKIGTDEGTTQWNLAVPGSSLSETQAAARRPFCQEARELVEELERATEMLPSPMAGIATRMTRKARAGEPPNVSDATDLLREWLWFAVDCLLADYLMGKRHDISILQLLTRRTNDDPGAIRIALADRLIALAKQGHVAAEASVLVEGTEALLGEVRKVDAETHSPVTARVAPHRELDGTECRRLTELTRTALRAIDGFVLYAGYGDSVYRFQGTTPTRASAPDAPSVRHGECEMANRETDQELVLDSLWEIREGPILRRREIADDLPSLRAWTLEKTQIVLVGAPLQELIVDVIMVTNDSDLGMRTITAASVAQVAGEEFRRQARGKHMEFGDVLRTSAGTLAAKEVYHACTMGGTRQLQGDDLLSLLGKALRMAATAGHATVAFPLVGANYGIEATDIAANYVRAFQEHAQGNKMPSLFVLSVPQGNDPVASAITSALNAHEERAAFASRKARVFISARKADYKYAAQVYQFLKSGGVSTFFSEESLPQLGSSDYRREIDRALDNAQHMIVVTSSVENVQSSWVEAEWGFFINEKRSGRKSGNLVTMAVGSLKPSDLPPSLRYYEVIGFDPEQFSRLCQYVGNER